MNTPRLVLALVVSLSLAGLASAEKPSHFDPKGKPPSEHTIRGQKALRASLPFDDERDFAEAKKGFIAAPKERQIKNANGEIVWDIGAFDFLLGDEEFDSIHPSLRRQALLNMNYGLYELSDEIYQVRGFDLANLTLVKGETGWIVFDVLTAKETAAAAMALVEEHLGKRPVKAIVYSHSHADHFAGVRGVVNEEDVRSGKVQILAPAGFLHHAVAENIFAGNAMNRRLFFQYGMLLPRHPMGHVDQSIGKAVSAGTAGLIRPTREIDQNMEKILKRGRELHDAGRYRLAQEILDKLAHAEPANEQARDLLADVWEQIGYQQESPSVRNSFLAAAYELRNGVPEGRSASTVGPDFIEAMTTGMFFDFMSIRLDTKKAGSDEFTINLITPDTGEQRVGASLDVPVRAVGSDGGRRSGIRNRRRTTRRAAG